MTNILATMLDLDGRDSELWRVGGDILCRAVSTGDTHVAYAGLDPETDAQARRIIQRTWEDGYWALRMLPG